MKILVQRVSRCYEPYFFNCIECGRRMDGENERRRGRCADCMAEELIEAENKARVKRGWRPLMGAERQDRLYAIIARERGNYPAGAR